MTAEIPQRMTEPSAPTVASENPSDAIRNPGLQSAITKPSYQWRDLRSCLSSMAASAMRHPLRRAPSSGRGGYNTGPFRPSMDPSARKSDTSLGGQLDHAIQSRPDPSAGLMM